MREIKKAYGRMRPKKKENPKDTCDVDTDPPANDHSNSIRSMSKAGLSSKTSNNYQN